MSLEKIRQKILEEAEGEAGRIIKEAEERAAALRQEAEKIAKARFEEEIENEKKTLALEEERIISEYRATTSAEVLRLKNQLIDEVFDRAIERILKLEDKKYLEIIAHYLSKNLCPGVDTLIISQRDQQRISRQWIESMLKKMQKNDLKIKIVTSPEIEGGFILRGEKAEIDCSLRQIIADKKEELTPAISRVLF
ncbi:MAG: V-type ATP synthase subunit E [bacterium]|nr:V-type ATP synthase subunit E [bacterium]